MKIKENYSLLNLNTFHINASAKYFIEVFSVFEMEKALKENLIKNEPVLILGGGSNILFTKDFNGLVIKNSIKGFKVVSENDNEIFIEAGAGNLWDELVGHCVNNDYGGIENLTLIPGTVGAAPIQNIGAYGQELKDSFYSLEGILFDNLSTKNFHSDECNFGYRNSIFKNELKNKIAITSVTFKLNKEFYPNLDYAALKEEIKEKNISKISIKEVSETVREIRKRKLPNPNEIGNAGSFFKNPEISSAHFLEIQNKYPALKGFTQESGMIKISAAWLIEQCGWKGRSIGNAAVHINQPLVLVNFNGNASGTEILHLVDQIKNSVKNIFDITLEEEVNII